MIDYRNPADVLGLYDYLCRLDKSQFTLTDFDLTARDTAECIKAIISLGYTHLIAGGINIESYY